MIETQKNGRRRSITTKEELRMRSLEAMSGLTEDEKDLLLALQEGVKRDDRELRDDVEGHIYHTKPVSMEQFLEDPYYLGESCTTIYPVVKQDLIDLFERPYREALFCLHPDTRVPLLKGGDKSLSELIEEWDANHETVWVYSVDKDGSVVPAQARDIRYTGEDDYYKVTLDDGSSFTGNSRHQMIMRDGKKKMIRDMNVGDSIMPFRRRSPRVVSIEPDGHGKVCCMTVPEYTNFAILADRPGEKIRSGVFSSNTGSIGFGKTFSASIIISRILYEMSCMVNPQKVFGLSSGSELAIPLISKNLILSKAVMKSAIDDKIKESPYFMTKFAPDFRVDYTLFPGNIRLMIGSYGSDRILGTNVVSAFCDEMNFPPKKKGQQISTAFGQRKDASHFDIVEKIYRGLLRRIKSRFQHVSGWFPGMIVLVSSAATTESFTERKIRESAFSHDIFVRDHTQWTAKPKDHFCGEMFYVLCSTSAMRSKILTNDECEMITDEYLEANDAFVMDIPIEFRDDFEVNMEDALRDIAGFATEAISQFIQRPKMIEVCTNKDRKHPFSKEEWIAGSPGNFDWDDLTIKYERRLPGGYTEPAFKPRRNPSAMRWCHIDTSISGDCTGFCIAHIDRWVDVVRRDSEGNKNVDIAPYYIVDFMLRIWPPPAEQIYMPDIRAMLYQFMDHGFRFVGFSSDTFQYIEYHQQIKRRGITPHLISMDKTTDPYDELKSAFYENRIEVYHYEPFVDEFKKLEYDRLVGKVDHPEAGSKDCSDSVAGSIWGLRNSASRTPMVGIKEESKLAPHRDAWVSPLIPSDKVDADEIRAIKEGDSAEEFMPIMFGD